MAPAKIHQLAEYVARRDVSEQEKLDRIAADAEEVDALARQTASDLDTISRRVGQLDVLARQNAEAQRATADAVAGEAVVAADQRRTITLAMTDLRKVVVDGFQAAREERELNRAGILEALGRAHTAQQTADAAQHVAREGLASDVDLLARVEREQAAREAEDARILGMIHRSVAPIVADATETAVFAAKDAAESQASNTRKLVAKATAALGAIVTVLQILREAGVLR